MKNKSNKLFVIGLISLLILFTSGKSEKTRILIIGDSISIGYTPFLVEHFSGKAVVIHNKGNAQHTGNGLKRIEKWIGSQKWDLIQFNWGLWDLCYRHPDSKSQGNRDKQKGSVTFTIDEYESNLDSLVSFIKLKTDAKLVFVTTTYVPENEVGRFVDDPIKYNAAAKRVMEKYSVEVNDIYNQSISIHKKYGLGTDNVHYTKAGYQKLSELVIPFLENEIEEMQ
jgi:lysophospholipase L1-like esterase